MKALQEKFLHELETFRKEAESAVQFWYGHLAIHAVASRDENVREALNKNALFWNTTLGALQTSAFIALGRIFDKNSIHNIDSLIRFAQTNSSLFSLPALRARKIEGSPNASEWIDGYMATAYEPTPNDFRRLRSHIKKNRQIYEARYQAIRHQVFAHNGANDESEIHRLFRATNVSEMQKLYIFLIQFHQALWQLYFNGRKPVISQMRFSTTQMIKCPRAEHSPISLQERIVLDTRSLLLSLTNLPPCP